MTGHADELQSSLKVKSIRGCDDSSSKVSANEIGRCGHQHRRDKQLGQGMTEYIIIVALVAVAAIAVYQSFGRVIRAQTAAIANELAGEKSSSALSAARSAAKDAGKQVKDKSLKNYGANSR